MWLYVFVFFKYTATTEIYTYLHTLSLHDALPIYGVNWYFERAVTDAGLPNAVGRTTWSTLAGSVLGNGGLSWTFPGRNAAAVIGALDEVTDVQILQSPSVLVRKHAEATFNVGSTIPISSVSFDPGVGGSRSDERTVGNKCVSPCLCRWSVYT